LTTQEMPAPLRMPSMQVLQARQRRIGSSLRSLLTHCGSATRGAAERDEIALAARHRRPLRWRDRRAGPTAITGTLIAFFTSAAKSRNGASGSAIGGIMRCAVGLER
jgi:hypothetical protein